MSFEFEYFYGNETEQFSFYRIPKMLFKDSILAYSKSIHDFADSQIIIPFFHFFSQIKRVLP